MINVTKHALTRYAERIKGFALSEVNGAVFDNSEIYKIELNKMFDFSRLVYTGKFNNNQITNFRVVDNIMLITDTQDSKIITLYKIGFGFNRAIDKTILDNLLTELDITDTEYIKAMDETKDRKEELEMTKFSLEEEISSIKELLKNMQDNLNGINKYIDLLSVNEMKARVQRDIIAKKIAYSIYYKQSVDKYVDEK